MSFFTICLEHVLTILLLQVSYAVSPLICFSVVGALKASQAAVS